MAPSKTLVRQQEGTARRDDGEKGALREQAVRCLCAAHPLRPFLPPRLLCDLSGGKEGICEGN